MRRVAPNFMRRVPSATGALRLPVAAYMGISGRVGLAGRGA